MQPIPPTPIPPQPSIPPTPPPPPVPPVIPTPPPVIPPPPPRKKSFFWLIVLVFLLLLASTSVLAYQYYQLKTQTTNPTSSPSLAPISTPHVSPQPSAEVGDWQTYTNTKYGYEIKYPMEWSVETDQWNSDIATIQSEQGRVIIDPTNRTKITEPIKDWIEESNKQLLSDPNRHSASSPMQIISYDNELKINETPMVIDASFFGREGKDFIFSHKNTMFYITAVYFNGEYDTTTVPTTKEIVDKRSQLINLIISTFKFTN